MFNVVFFYCILPSVIPTLRVAKSILILQRFMLYFILILFVVNIYSNCWNFFLLKCGLFLLLEKQPYTLLFSHYYVFRCQLPWFWSHSVFTMATRHTAMLAIEYQWFSPHFTPRYHNVSNLLLSSSMRV